MVYLYVEMDELITFSKAVQMFWPDILLVLLLLQLGMMYNTQRRKGKDGYLVNQMEMWFEFIKQNWLVFLIALIVLFVIVSFVKTMVKWALVVVIVAAVAVYSGITWDDVNNVVTTVTDEAVDKLKDQAVQAMMDEAKQADFTTNEDGTYTIKTSNLEMKGTPNSGKVNVSFRGVSLGEWDMNDSIRQFIQAAKQNK